MCTHTSPFSSKFGSWGSWGLISTVTISPRFDLRFLGYSFGHFSEVSLQRYFRRQNLDSYSAKSPNQWSGVTHNEPDNLILKFISWSWMTLITWPCFFNLVWPRAHLWFLFFFRPLTCLEGVSDLLKCRGTPLLLSVCVSPLTVCDQLAFLKVFC